MKFAVTVDGQKSSIPGRQDSNGKYYSVKVSCENGSTQGEWDYNAWNVKLDDISDGSKCTLAFTGGMSKEDYQNYIDAGVAYRRNTYRGKELKLNDAFWTSIQNGTFDDIYVGDYIVSEKVTENYTGNSNKVIWLVADIDNYLNTGSSTQKLKQHHLTIIPAEPLMNAVMNDTNTTKGGYYGSKMVSGCNGAYEGDSIQNCGESILDTVYNTYIQPVFENNIVKYSNSLTDKIDPEAINGFGTSTVKGATSSFKFVNNRKLDLMSEMNVYGGMIFSSTGYDIGIDNSQYAIFRLKPEYRNSYEGNKLVYWLKGVSTMSQFVFSGGEGSSNISSANTSIGVRPRFLIG